MNLRRIRQEWGLSLPAAANLTGVPARTLQDIERGADPKLSTIIKIATGLGVSLDDLCNLKEGEI